MKELVFDDASLVAEFAYKKAYELEDIGCVQVVGFYDEISEVLKEVLKYDETTVGNIELNSADYSGYCKEYYLTIDEDMVVSVEPGYYEEKEIYLQYEAETLIICDDCNSIIVKKNLHDNPKTYSYSYDDDCECECCDCEDGENGENDIQTGESTYVSRNIDGRVTGFSKSWSDIVDGVSYYSSYSHYSDNEESIRKIAKEFGIKL